MTAPFRPGEEIDCAALAGYLGQPVEVEQFPDGHSNLVYLVRTPGREFVLRKPPLGPVAPKAHDMAREYRVLEAIHPYFPEPPKVFQLSECPEIIGSPFFLMERRYGRLFREPGGPESASRALVDRLGLLHSLAISIPEI